MMDANEWYERECKLSETTEFTNDRDHGSKEGFETGPFRGFPMDPKNSPARDTSGSQINNLAKWDARFLDMAETVARWSKDPSTKCGAVIVRPNKSIASLGFNGFPRGMSDDPSIYADRPRKLARVIHAEMNAVLSAMEPLHGFTIYVTHPPCDRCCAHLIQAGLGRVVFRIDRGSDFEERWAGSLELAYAMFHEAGVEVSAYEREPHAGTGASVAAPSGRDGSGEPSASGDG
jgi:dCMP deaminase